MSPRPPGPPPSRRKRGRPARDGDGASAPYEQMLVAALTEADSTDVSELLERARDEAEGNEAVARRWIAAVRRVEQAGKLTTDEADSVVNDVAMAALSGASERDAELGRLAAQLKPLHEKHAANWEVYRARKEKAGALARLREPAWPRGMRALLDQYNVRYGAMYGALLDAMGETTMAREHRSDEKAHLQRMIRGGQALMRRGDERPSGYRVQFTAPEDVPLPSMAAQKEDGYSEEDEETLEYRVAQWAQATGEDGGMWTVPAVLAFATILSMDNEDGEGDAWIRSVREAHSAGVLDQDLAWLLLDRIASAMVPGEVGDPYQADLEEKFIDVEAEYGDVDESDEASVRKAPEAWQVLKRARDRRVAMLKVRVLRAAGEDELARAMEESPEAFRARMAKVAGIWEVDF